MQKAETKEPISFAEAKDIITKIIKEKKENDLEPTYEQESTLKYISAFEKLNKKDSEKLYKELVGLKIPANVAMNIVNIMPKEKETLEAILTKRSDFDDAKLVEIFKLLDNYRKE